MLKQKKLISKSYKQLFTLIWPVSEFIVFVVNVFPGDSIGESGWLWFSVDAQSLDNFDRTVEINKISW